METIIEFRKRIANTLQQWGDSRDADFVKATPEVVVDGVKYSKRGGRPVKEKAAPPESRESRVAKLAAFYASQGDNELPLEELPLCEGMISLIEVLVTTPIAEGIDHRGRKIPEIYLPNPQKGYVHPSFEDCVAVLVENDEGGERPETTPTEGWETSMVRIEKELEDCLAELRKKAPMLRHLSPKGAIEIEKNTYQYV